jgi:CheY-like chemotaxis protein
MSSPDLSTDAPEQDPGAALGSRRILIVEDSPVIGSATADMLAELGYEVVGPAPNMAIARTLVEEGGYDAALMDVHIRGERVFPLCEMLEARGIPFVFTSGYADWHMLEKWEARPRLQKPYTPQQVEEALKPLLA